MQSEKKNEEGQQEVRDNWPPIPTVWTSDLVESLTTPLAMTRIE